MFNKQSYAKNSYQLNGKFKKKGYDWWWHSFTGINEKTGEEKPFFIEFYTTNPSVSPSKVTYGRRKEIPSYLMVKCGAWGKNHTQLHHFIPFQEVTITKCPIEIKSGDFLLNETTLKGNITISMEEAALHPEWMCDAGSMSFDLKIEKKIAFNVGYGTSAIFRRMHAFEMYWHAQGMKSYYTGTVIFNGEKYNVTLEKSFGYADKNWGSDFTSPWIWLSSWDLYSHKLNKKLENSVFDIGGGKPKAFGIRFNNKLLGAFYYEGKEYQYNFSKFWHPSKTEFACEIGNEKVIWNIKQSDHHSVMETHIECNKEDMLLVNYEAPTGIKKHNNLYNGGNGAGVVKLYEKKHKKLKLIDEIDVGHVGCEFGEFDK